MTKSMVDNVGYWLKQCCQPVMVSNQTYRWLLKVNDQPSTIMLVNKVGEQMMKRLSIMIDGLNREQLVNQN